MTSPKISRHMRTRSTVDSLYGDDEGYLSPLEDTFSVLSDDAIPAQSAYVQVSFLLDVCICSRFVDVMEKQFPMLAVVDEADGRHVIGGICSCT